MAKLKREDVIKLASLARLKLSEDEIVEYAKELSEILEYVEKLDSVDTKGLKPTLQVNGLSNVTREDVLIDYGYKPEVLLKNVPKLKNNQIKANRMIE